MTTRRLCVVGLGNPGPEYRGTRHNIGFEWIDALEKSSAFGGGKTSEKFESDFRQISTEVGGTACEIHFLKPKTFMNLSGRAVKAWREKYQGESSLLVVYDDMDLPLGRIRFRETGSDGGHRGARSMIEHLGTSNFARLRLGVGRPAGESVDYVLGKFTPDERQIVNKIIADAENQLRLWITETTEKAMGALNGKVFGSIEAETKESK